MAARCRLQQGVGQRCDIGFDDAATIGDVTAIKDVVGANFVAFSGAAITAVLTAGVVRSSGRFSRDPLNTSAITHSKATTATRYRFEIVMLQARRIQRATDRECPD